MPLSLSLWLIYNDHSLKIRFHLTPTSPLPIRRSYLHSLWTSQKAKAPSPLSKYSQKEAHGVQSPFAPPNDSKITDGILQSMILVLKLLAIHATLEDWQVVKILQKNRPTKWSPLVSSMSNLKAFDPSQINHMAFCLLPRDTERFNWLRICTSCRWEQETDGAGPRF